MHKRYCIPRYQLMMLFFRRFFYCVSFLSLKYVATASILLFRFNMRASEWHLKIEFPLFNSHLKSDEYWKLKILRVKVMWNFWNQMSIRYIITVCAYKLFFYPKFDKTSSYKLAKGKRKPKKNKTKCLAQVDRSIFNTEQIRICCQCV